jgi:hypothetical protein
MYLFPLRSYSTSVCRDVLLFDGLIPSPLSIKLTNVVKQGVPKEKNQHEEGAILNMKCGSASKPLTLPYLEPLKSII